MTWVKIWLPPAMDLDTMERQGAILSSFLSAQVLSEQTQSAVSDAHRVLFAVRKALMEADS